MSPYAQWSDAFDGREQEVEAEENEEQKKETK